MGGGTGGSGASACGLAAVMARGLSAVPHARCRPAVRQGQLIRRMAALLALLLLAAFGTPAAAQQLTPFLGRGRPPSGGVDVYLSAVMDHLIEIDDANYRFEVGTWRRGERGWHRGRERWAPAGSGRSRCCWCLGSYARWRTGCSRAAPPAGPWLPLVAQRIGRKG